MQEWKTVKQLADELSVSKTTIRNRFTDDFREKYTQTTSNKVILISAQGCKEIAETMQITANVFPQSIEKYEKSEEKALIDVLQSTINTLTSQLSVKDEQLITKDKQIFERDKQIKMLTETLQETTTALTSAQALHAGTIQQQLIETPASNSINSGKIGIFKRLFRRK